MRYFFIKLIFVFLLIPQLALSSAIVKKINFDEKQNIEIITDQKTLFKTYTLRNPDRIVVDIENASLETGSIPQNFPEFINKIRNSKNSNNLRVVFDLKQKLNIQSAGFNKLSKDKFGKIVIKITPEISYVLNKTPNPRQKNITKKEIIERIEILKTPIIVIDAGHGGKDPGTIGDYARTKEKNITLSYAKELAKHLSNTKRYIVYLTRNSDRFIPLKERVAKARKVKADLFISLHANAASDQETKGFSVYTLSENSSDKQAELLAQKENRADIISGINFNGTSGDILKTLIDLSQRNSMNHSSRFANIAIRSVKKYDINILHNTHRFAGFVVLTAPDMVSVLIELGYLSNNKEEKALNSLGHKRNIIKGLVESIDEYFKFK